MANWWMILKTLVRSSLDSYVLPGTVTGTDILLLYMTQWKRHVALVASATFYLIFSQFDLPRIDRVWSEASEEMCESDTTAPGSEL